MLHLCPAVLPALVHRERLLGESHLALLWPAVCMRALVEARGHVDPGRRGPAGGERHRKPPPQVRVCRVPVLVSTGEAQRRPARTRKGGRGVSGGTPAAAARGRADAGPHLGVEDHFTRALGLPELGPGHPCAVLPRFQARSPPGARRGAARCLLRDSSSAPTVP